MASDLKEVIGWQTIARGVSAWATWWNPAGSRGARRRGLTVYLIILTLLFVQPLARLIWLAAQSSLQSYILLVPLISGYLLFLGRERLLTVYRSSAVGTVLLGAIGTAALVLAIAWHKSLNANDGLTLMVFAYVNALAAGGFLFFGSRWMRAAAFPISFLIFMVPLPDAMVSWLENASATASAEAAAMYFNLLGTPLVRHGRVFELPGVVLQVAHECSGIHSSLVLFITSLIAGQLFLKSWWGRIVMAAFVIPLGILRNGFRILIIGLLCVHIGPEMIHSRIHRHGGPIFFALSLIPLVLVLIWLRRRETKKLNI